MYDHLEDEALTEFLDGFPSVSREQVLGLFQLSQRILYRAFKYNLMKTLEETREIVKEVIVKRCIGTNEVGEVRDELIQSTDLNRFLVICVGWEKDKNQYMLIHDVQIREDCTVIIHADNTDKDMADYLISAGIPEIMIVKSYDPDAVGLLNEPKPYGS